MTTKHKQPLEISLHEKFDSAQGFGPELESIRIENGDIESFLEISFRRILRVPDNGKSYNLPPEFGKFPIYSVHTFSSTLPADISSKGGCFIPIYRKYRHHRVTPCKAPKLTNFLEANIS